MDRVISDYFYSLKQNASWLEPYKPANGSDFSGLRRFVEDNKDRLNNIGTQAGPFVFFGGGAVRGLGGSWAGPLGVGGSWGAGRGAMRGGECGGWDGGLAPGRCWRRCVWEGGVLGGGGACPEGLGSAQWGWASAPSSCA